MRVRILSAVLTLFASDLSAAAYIQAEIAMQQVLAKTQLIFTAKIEAFDAENVRDATQIVQVRVSKFTPDDKRMELVVEQDLKAKMPQRTMPVVWKLEPDSKWEGVRTLPRALKSFGPNQHAILFINDSGGFWHNKGATRKNPIAFGFINGSWFCMESRKLDDGQMLWILAQGEPYLRTTFKGTTAELNKVLVDHFKDNAKLPGPVKSEPGFGPEYQPKK